MLARDDSWTTWRGRTSELATTHCIVLGGGTSSERAVSMSSGPAMFEALGVTTPGAPRVPGSVEWVEIEADGRWRVGDEHLEPVRALDALRADALFVLGLHGGMGEDGRLQAFLEVAGRRYTGAGPAASALCLDKQHARQAAEAAGLRVAPARFVAREAWTSARAGELDALLTLGAPSALGEGPWFVKPNRGGSSVDVARATGEGELARALTRVVEGGDDALVELGVSGLEATVSVVGNRGEEPVLLPVCEILPQNGRFFDYEEKYSAGGALEFCPPEHLSDASAVRLQERALAAYRALGCEGYARIDFIVPEDGVRGDAEPVFLEANTLPGFTSRSLLPQAAAATGVEFRSLCLELCSRALARFEEVAL